MMTQTRLSYGEEDVLCFSPYDRIRFWIWYFYYISTFPQTQVFWNNEAHCTGRRYQGNYAFRQRRSQTAIAFFVVKSRNLQPTCVYVMRACMHPSQCIYLTLIADWVILIFFSHRKKEVSYMILCASARSNKLPVRTGKIGRWSNYTLVIPDPQSEISSDQSRLMGARSHASPLH